MEQEREREEGVERRRGRVVNNLIVVLIGIMEGAIGKEQRGRR